MPELELKPITGDNRPETCSQSRSHIDPSLSLLPHGIDWSPVTAIDATLAICGLKPS